MSDSRIPSVLGNCFSGVALVDQAALFGVLNNLYSLGFPLLSVESELRSDYLDKAIKAPNQMKRSSINERPYKSDKKEISRCGE